jgi:hypothetical protein
MAISDFNNYGKLKIFFPNQVNRMIRIADLGLPNPTPVHNGIASYTFAGWTEGEPVNPGAGCMSLNEDMLIVLNVTDKNGNYMEYNLEMIAMGMDYYNFWLFLHSKRDPKIWVALILYDYDVITEGEGDDEHIVAWVFEIWPVFFSSVWDEGEGDLVPTEFIGGEEILLSLQISVNLEQFGDMAFQDPGGVYIWGGDIGGVNLWGGEDKRWTLPYKTTTGDPIGAEERIYVNRFDKLVRIYLDGAWRTLLDFS